jgi:hypothetical protein
VHDDLRVVEPRNRGFPLARVVLTVGEKNDRPALGGFLFIERVESRVQSSTQVSSTWKDVSRPERLEDVDDRAEIFCEWAPEDPSPRERDDCGSAPGFAAERANEPRGRLRRNPEAIRNGVLRAHAATRVNQEDDIVPRRKPRAQNPPPPRSSESDD